MDTLSSILVVLRPRSHLSAGLEAGEPWSLRFAAPEGIKFNAVVRGSAWVSVEGHPTWHRVEDGDCFLLPLGRPFILTSDRSLRPSDAEPLYAAARENAAVCNGGGSFSLVGGRFAFQSELSSRLFGALPPVVVVDRSLDHASTLRWGLQQLAAEVRHAQPGSALIAEHLAQIMLVQVVRLILASGRLPSVGWLAALADPRLGRALHGLHADPGRPWTLPALARLAGMSRSSFAQRFREVLGATPGGYLTEWRMELACHRLVRSEETISEIASSLGYESESSFSTAFRRVRHCSPREHRRGARG